MAPHDEQVRQLIRRGLLPSQAERIVAQAAARDHQLLTPAQAVRQSTVTATDIEQARSWFYYSPAVPYAIKRMPDARSLS
jgi:hypothetical protein